MLIPCNVKDADGVNPLLQTADSNLTINACGWVVLDTQINVLIDAKSKVPCVTEVPSEQLILLDLQPTLLQEESHILRAVSVMIVCMIKQCYSLLRLPRDQYAPHQNVVGCVCKEVTCWQSLLLQDWVGIVSSVFEVYP